MAPLILIQMCYKVIIQIFRTFKKITTHLLARLGGGSCGVRARKALFYKAFAGSYFLSGSVKNRHFLRKWCSKWCSKIVVEVKKQKIEKTSEKSLCLIKLIL